MTRRGNSLSLDRILFVAACVAVIVGSGNAHDVFAAARKPNIIFIMADDLGYGDLGCYGQTQIQTPNIDQFAAEGMRFTQFYAGSTVCAPSRCVLMTGLHLGHCYIRGNGKINLRPDDLTVAEVLKAGGYATGLVGKWGIGHEGSTGVPTRQGFDSFFGYLDQHHAHNYYPTFLIRGESRVHLTNVVPGEGPYGQGVATVRKEYSPDLMETEVLTFIDQHQAEPFFLYFAATLPHANDEAKNEGMEIPDYGMYQNRDWPEPQKGLAAMIGHLDGTVGKILERLKRFHIDENTIVFFTSDNGPHHEGGNNPDFFNSNGPLRGIKRALYEGGIRVPMIVRWPGRIAAGTDSDLIGYFGDFLPTAAQLAGVNSPKGIDGLSIVPTLLGNAEKQRQHEYLYWEFYEQSSRQAVRMGDWKAVIEPMHSENMELYDLSRDIGENQDVADKHPEVAAKIRTIVKQAHVPSPLWTVRKKPAKKRSVKK